MRIVSIGLGLAVRVGVRVRVRVPVRLGLGLGHSSENDLPCETLVINIIMIIVCHHCRAPYSRQETL